ncbi:MAG: PIG-L family deacetylase [Actinobacteria bacterium]|nr:PIG-L family deacetylase [Actinomycetota bacterium]
MSRVLFISAHPDDIELACGGTVLLLKSKHYELHLLICTHGDKGTHDRTLTAAELMRIRESEQRKASSIMGLKSHHFLEYLDGELIHSKELVEKITFHIRRVCPDMLITFDPFKRYQLHSDHRSVGLAALDARLSAKLPLYYPNQLKEGLDVCEVKEIWLFDPDEANFWLDVSSVWDKRFEMLTAHESQLEKIMNEVREFITMEAKKSGEKIGASYAEAFRRISFNRFYFYADGT